MISLSRGQGLVTASDGLPALEVAEHAKEKEFVIERIVSIFNVGMQHKWKTRYYVDLFAGPGLCRVRGSNTEIDGSPIVSVKSKPGFTHHYFADESADALRALERRVSDLLPPTEASTQYYVGSADHIVARVIKDLPAARSSLGLALFDPWGWDFSFDTLADVSAGRNLDLVINFPIGFIKRNWMKNLSKLDEFMGGATYKGGFRAAMRKEASGELPTRVLLNAYSIALARIGYQHTRDHVVVSNTKNLPLYHLVFASKNERGADFWDKVTQRLGNGQLRMFS